jgi:hypothetical protein
VARQTHCYHHSYRPDDPSALAAPAPAPQSHPKPTQMGEAP